MVKSHLFLATLFAAFLATSGCSWFQGDTQIEILREPTEVFIPPSNRSCAAIPLPPNPDMGATQRDVAAWIPEVYAAHAECRSDLNVVVGIVSEHNAEARRISTQNAAQSD